MTALSDLIARLEAAKEGSRELDREIALIAGWKRMWSEDRGHGGFYWKDGPNNCTRTQEDNEHPPLYSTSLDAALTLARNNYEFRTMLRAALNACEGEADNPVIPWDSIRAALVAALKAREARR